MNRAGKGDQRLEYERSATYRRARRREARRSLYSALAATVVAAAGCAAVLASCAAEASRMSCDTDAQCAALPACAAKPGCDGTPWTQPARLIGYGCAGASGPLYRDEEDEFPAGGCRSIEALGG